MEPGGYVWQNFLGGFVLEAKYEVWEMNLSGFTVPANRCVTDAPVAGPSTPRSTLWPTRITTSTTIR